MGEFNSVSVVIINHSNNNNNNNGSNFSINSNEKDIMWTQYAVRELLARKLC